MNIKLLIYKSMIYVSIYIYMIYFVCCVGSFTVDTAQDVLDRGLRVSHPPDSWSTVEIMKNSPSSVYRDLFQK